MTTLGSRAFPAWSVPSCSSGGAGPASPALVTIITIRWAFSPSWAGGATDLAVSGLLCQGRVSLRALDTLRRRLEARVMYCAVPSSPLPPKRATSGTAVALLIRQATRCRAPDYLGFDVRKRREAAHPPRRRWSVRAPARRVTRSGASGRGARRPSRAGEADLEAPPPLAGSYGARCLIAEHSSLRPRSSDRVARDAQVPAQLIGARRGRGL